jgi:hypothetical protein
VHMVEQKERPYWKRSILQGQTKNKPCFDSILDGDRSYEILADDTGRLNCRGNIKKTKCRPSRRSNKDHSSSATDGNLISAK